MLAKGAPQKAAPKPAPQKVTQSYEDFFGKSKEEKKEEEKKEDENNEGEKKEEEK